jgi:hypothetical protein
VDQGGPIMKLNELRAKLEAENFPNDTFNLDGNTPKNNDGVYVLSKVEDIWIILLIDRGNRIERFSSFSEEEACSEFYRLMKRDIGF